MSAISGIIFFDGSAVGKTGMDPVIEVIAAYGPEGGGEWIEGPVGLASRGTNLSRTEQGSGKPVERDGFVIVADARIDNRKEMFERLGILVSEREEMTDSELVLRCYQCWGENCPIHLIGDYAFAIWDAKARRLFCARDHIGARPFYYYRTPRLFAFASDIRAVLAFPGVEGKIDEAEIACMLVSETPAYYDPESTFFRDLRKLPFGCRLSLDGSAVRTSRYWTPEAIPALNLPSREAYADRLRELVRQAVADRCAPGGRTGVHLSGGLDSSAVTVLAARTLRGRGEPVPTALSWSPPPTGTHEGEHRRIAAVCRQEGLRCIFAEMSEAEWRALLSENRATRPRSTLGLERHLQRRAQEVGVRVVLSGWGGDEAASFNGRGLLAEYLRDWRWQDAFDDLFFQVIARHPGRMLTALRRLWRNGMMPLLYESSALARHALRRRGRPYIRPEFLARMRNELRPGKKWLREPVGARACQMELYYSGFLPARIESWASYGSDHGLIYVYPLLDRRVLEFVYAAPVELHRQNGSSRCLFRQAMASLVPAEVVRETAKSEPVLSAQRQTHRLDKSWLNLGGATEDVDNPWVDVGRLSADIARGPRRERSSEHIIPKVHAITGVMLWRQFRKQFSTPLERNIRLPATKR